MSNALLTACDLEPLLQILTFLEFQPSFFRSEVETLIELSSFSSQTGMTSILESQSSSNSNSGTGLKWQSASIWSSSWFLASQIPSSITFSHSHDLLDWLTLCMKFISAAFSDSLFNNEVKSNGLLCASLLDSENHVSGLSEKSMDSYLT